MLRVTEVYLTSHQQEQVFAHPDFGSSLDHLRTFVIDDSYDEIEDAPHDAEVHDAETTIYIVDIDDDGARLVESYEALMDEDDNVYIEED